MNARVKTTADGTVLVLAQGDAERLGLRDGEQVDLTRANDGRVEVSGEPSETERQIALGRQVMDDFPETFRNLAR